MENSRNVSVGDLIYGSDAYYGQVTRVGGSVVEFTTVGLMPAGPKGDQGDQGPIGPQGPQGIQGIPGEIQIKDMPSVNLAMPDLSNATDLGGGVYRIYDNNGVTVDYNVFDGIWTYNGTATGTTFFDFTAYFAQKQMTYTYYYVSGSVSNPESQNFNYYTQDGVDLLGITLNRYDVQMSSITRYDIRNLYLRIQKNQVYNNYKFKLQLEVGSRATPYIVPGQIPQYAIEAQEEWITPTLLNGSVQFGNDDIRYYRNSIGEVRLKGAITNVTNGTIMFILPVGYRPDNSYLRFPVVCASGYGRVTINVGGVVTMTNISGDWVDLSNISFKAV